MIPGERQTLMTPGEVHQIEIRLFPTANLFRAGHRIRLEISSSNYPRFDPNPNTGEPLGRHTRMVPADNTVHHAAGASVGAPVAAPLNPPVVPDAVPDQDRTRRRLPSDPATATSVLSAAPSRPAWIPPTLP